MNSERIANLIGDRIWQDLGIDINMSGVAIVAEILERECDSKEGAR